MSIAIPGAQRRLILALLCVASFSVVFNNLIIAPILPDISEDLRVRVSIVGLLVTAYAVVGGIAAVFSGPFIDRLGRKPVVVAGMSVLTVATILSAIAPSFAFLLAARAMAGLGVACLTPAVFAAVGDYFSYEERGRAMSWVVTANTSASIFGVPAGAVISGVLSWRWTFVLLTVLLGVFTWLIFFRLPEDAPRTAEQSSAGMRNVLIVARTKSTMMAILSNFIATSYWFVFATYMGAYFYDEFGLAKWALGALTMVMGIGVLIGSNVGGRLSDRIGKRPIIIWSSAFCALFIFLATTASPHIAFGFGFLLMFGIFGGARFASAQAIMTEMTPKHRGTVMALNASGQQFGIVAGSALGGLALELWGYTGLGPMAAGLAIISILTYALFVDEQNMGTVAAELVPANPHRELPSES